MACERRVVIAETGVEAAKIGGFLLFGGDPAQLDPMREVSAIFYVDALDEAAEWVELSGAEITHKLRVVTGGRNLTARHPDGLVAEYFEASAEVAS